MKMLLKIFLPAGVVLLLSSTLACAGKRHLDAFVDPFPVDPGDDIVLVCEGADDTEWLAPLTSAMIDIKPPKGKRLVKGQPMDINGISAAYTFTIPSDGKPGDWKFTCTLRDETGKAKLKATFAVAEAVIDGPIAEHNTILSYDGPSTCISCHEEEATEMLDSLHMNWSGPTPELVNTNGEELGKAVDGINTFCTYAMSSKNACFSCHVRADGNAPDAPTAEDVDCLMCHSDTYQRKFVSDPDNPVIITDYRGKEKTYIFAKVDDQGNYMTVPDYDKMPVGTNMVNVARYATLPTTKSCLRCHATAGGGDWVKRGDMGQNSATARVKEDVHLSSKGADLSCVSCHTAANHKIGGRGIDLRQTEAPPPTCQGCHEEEPHDNSTLNRHATGQVSCQVCHIRKYAKGGATEMSRDWLKPTWNPKWFSGQGGYVGHEVKKKKVKPEYVWFDGTSYVYNIGETIEPDPETGVYHTASAQGGPFDGKSSIVPVKRHFTSTALHEESSQIIPPVILMMFMTGSFDEAVQAGMEEQGMTGNYEVVVADAEMMITHGVEPKEMAPKCADCHDGSGSTPARRGILPFAALGYHEVPAAVSACTLCHEEEDMERDDMDEEENMNWVEMHEEHREEGITCTSCHTSEPTGLVDPQHTLCASCHERESWRDSQKLHEEHVVEESITCDSCHTFS